MMVVINLEVFTVSMAGLGHPGQRLYISS